MIVPARPSTIMLNRSGENGHPCVVSDFRRKALNTVEYDGGCGCHIRLLLC